MYRYAYMSLLSGLKGVGKVKHNSGFRSGPRPCLCNPRYNHYVITSILRCDAIIVDPVRILGESRGHGIILPCVK